LLASTNSSWSPRRRSFFYFLLSFILLLITGYMLRHPILAVLGRALVEDDGIEKADCILVPGGDSVGTRIVRAAQLARAGYAPYVFVDGPAGLMGHESDATIRYATLRGFPAALFKPVWLPQGLDSTSEEMKFVANGVLKQSNVKTVLLVTSNFHTRRAARFLRKAAPWLKVIAVPAPDPYFQSDAWWKTRNGKKTFLFEWTKTISEWWGA
jgi:uncharacterized SAM-binding protein YcdF (DUF218 family)